MSLPGTDTTAGLTQRGTMRLVLPAAEFISAPSNDVRRALTAGVADRPPRLDDPKKQARLVAWLRLRPGAAGSSGAAVNLPALSWAGANAVEIDQRKTITGRVVGESTAPPTRSCNCPAARSRPSTLQIEVAEEGQAYRVWQRVEDLALVGRDAPAYVLDSEAGTIRFGDNVRGRIPPLGARIRVGMMRSGGGLAGNLPPGSLTAIEATMIDGGSAAGKLKVQQGLATEGGDDAETLAQAEQRIPALFRHRNRAVTAEDYRQLAGGDARRAPGPRGGAAALQAAAASAQRAGRGVGTGAAGADRVHAAQPAARPLPAGSRLRPSGRAAAVDHRDVRHRLRIRRVGRRHQHHRRAKITAGRR